MKPIWSVVLAAGLALVSCSQFDDSAIWKELNAYKEELQAQKERIEKLEDLCREFNTNISSLQTAIKALNDNDYVTNVSPVTRDRVIIGYTITFSKSGTITIYHGEDGKNSGDAPVIGVKKDTDGIYYWTVDGAWLLDESGNKVKAQGTDGAPGQNGADGQSGAAGQNGVTPQLKIEEGYWHVSYDNGVNWTQLDKAVGETGATGEHGDSFFKSVDIVEGYLCLVLNDDASTEIRIPYTGTDNPTEPDTSSPIKKVCFNFGASAGTKSVMVGNVVAWDADDVVGILYPNGNQVDMAVGSVVSNSSDMTNVTLDAAGLNLNPNDTYYAYTPYVKKVDGRIPFSYVGQKACFADAVGNINLGGYNIMASSVGTVSGDCMNFELKVLGAVMNLTIIVPETATYTKISIETNDASLSCDRLY